MRTRYRYLILALAAAAILALTACGDDDDGPTATTEGAATDAPTATGDTQPTSDSREANFACQVIPLPEVIVALRVSADEVAVTDEGATCTYETAGATLTIELEEEASAEGADATVEERAGDGEPVGVGTVGYRDGGTITASHLQYVITYTLEPADDEQLLALGRVLARFQPPQASARP